MTITNILIVGAGGFLGSIARFVSVRSIDGRLNAVFPYGTLVVNLVGSFILGFVMALMMKKADINEQWKIFLGAGFCGGFTTFSAFAWENLALLEGKMAPTALLYIGVSLAGGLLAVGCGAWLARIL
jgi:fluoride exporter